MHAKLALGLHRFLVQIGTPRNTGSYCSSFRTSTSIHQPVMCRAYAWSVNRFATAFRRFLPLTLGHSTCSTCPPNNSKGHNLPRTKGPTTSSSENSVAAQKLLFSLLLLLLSVELPVTRNFSVVLRSAHRSASFVGKDEWSLTTSQQGKRINQHIWTIWLLYRSIWTAIGENGDVLGNFVIWNFVFFINTMRFFHGSIDVFNLLWCFKFVWRYIKLFK